MTSLELTLSKIREQNQWHSARLHFAPAATSQKFPLQFSFAHAPEKSSKNGKGNFCSAPRSRAGGGIRSRAKNFLPLNPFIFCQFAEKITQKD